jgi:hypothetical protein
MNQVPHCGPKNIKQRPKTFSHPDNLASLAQRMLAELDGGGYVYYVRT